MPICRCWLLVVLTVAPGCAGLRVATPEPTPPPPMEVRGVVFAVDGAGGFQATSQALRQAVADRGMPLYVKPVAWSHGYGRFLADHTDLAHVREAGRQLADAVCVVHRQTPNVPVYLVGHSAGSAVVLAAAEMLAPGSVERIVLLAPAVSTCYDLRRALANTRQGVDVFYSERDRGYLGVGVALVGTTDRQRAPAAGRVGFRPIGKCPADAALYGKLHQHAWNPCVAWTGNHGGHYGGYQPGFLRAYVLPLLTP